MKKLFTLIALLAVFMGAKAEWVEDYKVDYSTYTGFPFWVMGYVPEWYDGVMTDFGGKFEYAEVKDDAARTSDIIVKTNGGVQYYKLDKLPGDDGNIGVWHQYFIADGIPTELDGSYTVKAMVKASEAVTINVNMGWGWNSGEQVGASVSIGTEWAEVEWEYSGIGGTKCNLVAQPNTAATIEWKWLTVSHNAKPAAPTTWQEWLTSDGKPAVIESTSSAITTYMGNAETPWPTWALELTDGVNINWRGDRTGEICAWALTMGKNYQESVINEDSPRARPYPADIEAEEGNESNHVFAVHVDQIGVIDAPEPDNNSIQWSNQFWIQSPQGWKEGTQVRVKFRYKAKLACKASTQIHQQNPSNYKHYEAIGDVNFTTEWQEFDKTITFNGSQATGWSVAFNLCADSKAEAPQPANVFYFDDLSWETMVLDEGLFVASSNSAKGIEYDFANATQFVEDDGLWVATVGTAGKEDTWVNEVMISTVRGNDAAFKGATLKPTAAIVGGEEDWVGYTEGSVAKIKLPAAGVWKISIATDTKEMNFVKLEGEAAKEPIDIVTNPEVLVIKGVERDWLGAKDDGTPQDGEEGTGAGNTWDNQFFIVANRVLEGGEETVIEFDYVATVAAKSYTGTHAAPGAYRKNAFGDVAFTTEEQHFKADYTIPAAGWGGDAITDAQSISFDMAVIKSACDYTIKNVKWYLKGDANENGKTTENLINATGTDNFKVKIGAGNNVLDWGTDTGINSIVKGKTNSSAVIYNLAGQRVSGDYKGIVVKEGKKYLAK